MSRTEHHRAPLAPIRPNRRFTTLGGTALATILALTPCLTPAPVSAASSPSPEPTEALAQASGAGQKIAFDIPAQPLADALDRFTAITGWQLGYASDLAKGLTSTGITGTMSAEDALTRLLTGTGLLYMENAPGLGTLAPLSSGEHTTLDAVRVEGLRNITSYEGTEGYVSYYSVAATKTDTPILETPQSISVIAREEMEDRDVKTVAEAVRYSPGVLVDHYGVDPRGYDSINIRGFYATTTGSFRDGLRMVGNYFAVPATEPYGMERMDIMRGPSGALYGQAEAGGVIDRTTKRPLADMRQEVYLEGGNWNTFEGGFDIGGAATEDEALLFRLTGLVRQADTEFDYNDGTEQDNDRIFFAPAVTWNPTEDTNLTLMATYLKDSRGTQFNTFANETVGRTDVVGGEPGFDRFKQEQVDFGYDFSHRFNDMWSVRQVARYTHVDVDYQTVTGDSLSADNTTLNRSVWAAPDVLDQMAIDNQVQTNFSAGPTDHVLLMGADFSYSKDTFSYSSGAVAPLDITNVAYTGVSLPAPYQETEQLLAQAGVYAQDQITLYDNLILTLGGRYSWMEQTTEQLLTNTTEVKTDAAFTGRAGITYVFDNGIAPYFGFTQGFVPTEGTSVDGKTYDPQRSTQYEVGIKYQPETINALLTAAIFRTTKTNVLTRDPADINNSVLAGEVRSQGVELEAKASLFDGWDMSASYTYTDAEVTKSNDVDFGKTPVLVPEHTATAWLGYTFGSGPLKGLALGSGMRFVGSTFNDRENTSRTADYVLVDAMARYDITENTRLQVNANNLLDTDYVTTCAYNSCYYGPGMRVNARLTYSW
jgi:iron complex outermembrane receptor protein